MPARARLARSVSHAATLARPWRVARPQVQPRILLGRLAPTRRSLAVGFGILAFTLCGYLLARETALFAIDRIEVEGGSPQTAGQVRQALAAVVGGPLVGLDGASVVRKVDALPTVVSATYDRAFPHTLRVTVVPERPAAVLRSGASSWLLSARGRVMERLSSLPRLPRIWVSTGTPVRLGSQLATSGAATAARAVGLSGAFAARVVSAADTGGALVFRLRSGIELLLGTAGDVSLKVAVAARALEVLPVGSTFLDVSVPARPVAGAGSAALTTTTSSGRG